MLTIGFANQYYTLWDIGQPYKKYGAGMVINGSFTGSFDMVQDCTYLKNLSMDFEQAKAKVAEPFDIDLDLRGSHTWVRSTGKVGSDFPLDRFPYGQLMGELISECSNVWQLQRIMDDTSWANSPRRRVYARRRLIEMGELVRRAGMYITSREAAYLSTKEQEAKLNGHYFQNGEKVKVSIKQVGGFSFDTAYGVTFIRKYLLEDGRMVKYMGSNPPEISSDSFIPVCATVKHSEYNGQAETKLQRIKVSCPVS